MEPRLRQSLTLISPQVLLDVDSKPLKDYGVTEGAALLVELITPSPGEVAVGAEEEAEFDENAGCLLPRQIESSEEAHQARRKRPRVEVSEEYRRRRSSPSVVRGSFGDMQGSLRLTSLVRCFLAPEKVSAEDRLGEMAFNMFTAAARMSALENARRDLSLSFLEGDPPSLRVTFRCNRKSYEDLCRFYPEEVVVQLVREVYKTTITRTRRSPEACKRLFEVKELCSRAPYVLWSVAFSEFPNCRFHL